MYFLKISGFIPQEKFRELKQSLNLLNLDSEGDCEEFRIFQGLNEQEYVQFFSIWKDSDNLRTFMGSHTFSLLKGLFKTLGVIKEVSHGKYEEQEDLSNNLSNQ